MLGLIEQMFWLTLILIILGELTCALLIFLLFLFTPLALIAGFANTKSIAYFKGVNLPVILAIFEPDFPRLYHE